MLQWGPKSTENRLSSTTVTEVFNCTSTRLARQSELEKLVIYPSQQTSSRFSTPPYKTTTMALLNLQGRCGRTDVQYRKQDTGRLLQSAKEKNTERGFKGTKGKTKKILRA